MSQIEIERHRVLPEALSDPAADNYLGNADLVNMLVGKFCAKIEAVRNATIANAVSGDQAIKECDDEIQRLADIFSGRDDHYKKIIGYNDFTLPAKLRADLSAYRRMCRPKWLNDPVAVLFDWMASLIFEAAKRADGDEILFGVILMPDLQYTVQVLLGIEKRLK